jgi:tetratricopeptide (TPR) repeat protein
MGSAEAGNIARAADDARRYLDQHPDNAGAAYNLAVFLEAMGEYEEALAMYDRALSLGNKSFYVKARAGCARRLAAAHELSAEPVSRDARGNLAAD